MSVQHEKYKLAALSQIITQTFGDFRPCNCLGGNLLAISVLSGASNGGSVTFLAPSFALTAGVWRFSFPQVP